MIAGAEGQTRFAEDDPEELRCGLLRRPVYHRRVRRAVAVSANFADSYQIDPDLSIGKMLIEQLMLISKRIPSAPGRRSACPTGFPGLPRGPLQVGKNGSRLLL